jgi:hypothetical protein
MGVGVNVGAGVNVSVAVAGAGGVGGAVVGEDNSACVGTGAGLLQAVRNIIPIRVVRSARILFMIEL